MSPAGDHVAQDAAGLAALPPGDPLREEAYAHARECPECARALRQGEQLAALLGEVPAPPAPSPEVMRRVSAAVLAEWDREDSVSTAVRAPVPARAGVLARWALVASPLAAWGAVLLAVQRRVPDIAVWQRSFVLAVVASLIVHSAVFGRPSLLVAGAATVLSLFDALLASRGGELHALLGVHCAATELAAAVLPLGATAYVAARRGLEGGAGLYAGIAAAGALAGQAALHLACPASHDGPHLYAFHVGGVVLAAMLGALASRGPWATSRVS